MGGHIINIDPEILGGTPVFYGTRVPIKNLFDYLETGESIDFFLEDFSGVKREQVINFLKCRKNLLKHRRTFYMKILPDECVTKHLKLHLRKHEVLTVREMEWSGIRNEELMTLCVERHFDMLLTIDKNLQYQQNLDKYHLTIVVLNSFTSKVEELVRFLPEFEARLKQFEKRQAYLLKR